MEKQSAPAEWLQQVPTWLKTAVAAITGTIGVMLLVRENLRLSIVVFVAVILGSILYGSVYILVARMRDAEGKPPK